MDSIHLSGNNPRFYSGTCFGQDYDVNSNYMICEKEYEISKKRWDFTVSIEMLEGSMVKCFIIKNVMRCKRWLR